MHGRGTVGAAATAAFRDAGYGDRAALDVVMIVARKTISDYVNRLADVEVDAAARRHACEPPEASPD